VIAADAAGNLGQNPHGIVFDEVIAQPNRELCTVIPKARARMSKRQKHKGRTPELRPQDFARQRDSGPKNASARDLDLAFQPNVLPPIGTVRRVARWPRVGGLSGRCQMYPLARALGGWPWSPLSLFES
jgi:hypothetical protein